MCVHVSEGVQERQTGQTHRYTREQRGVALEAHPVAETKPSGSKQTLLATVLPEFPTHNSEQNKSIVLSPLVLA